MAGWGSRGRDTLLVVFLVGRAGRSGSPLRQRLGLRAGAAFTAFPNAGTLPHLAAQVVEPSLANLPVAQDLDSVDARRVNQEGAFHAHPVRHTADGEVPAQAASGHPDHQ